MADTAADDIFGKQDQGSKFTSNNVIDNSSLKTKIIENNVLNGDFKNATNRGSQPDKLLSDLQNILRKITTECVSIDRKLIDYNKVKTSKHFIHYNDLVRSLNQLQVQSLNDDDKTAFFINIYNGLTIHGLCELETLPSSVLDIKQFWRNTSYNIGGLTLSLSDIEHGILRCNRPHPSSTTPPLATSDPRASLSLLTLDPRIHFALVNGAKSSPALNVYSGKALNQELEDASRAFVQAEVCMFTEVSEIWLPKNVQWYRSDFGFTDVDVIRWMIPYLTKPKQNRAELLLYQLESIGRVDIKYTPFDWRLNCVPTEKATLTYVPADDPGETVSYD